MSASEKRCVLDTVFNIAAGSENLEAAVTDGVAHDIGTAVVYLCQVESCPVQISVNKQSGGVAGEVSGCFRQSGNAT